jgi:glutaredoxin 3
MAKLTVYSTDSCSFCERAKRLLDARGHAYEEINLERDPDGRARLAQRTGMMTFPQILIGDELVGGFAELVQAERSGRLTQLLAGHARL